MLKVYVMPNGRKYQFEESKAPKEAVEVKAAKPPKNKARKAENK